VSITLDATFFAFVALAIFLAGLLYLRVPSMLAKALDDRANEIAKELAEARRLKEEALRLRADYDAKRAAAEAEAKTIIAHARDQAALIAVEARAQATDAIARRRRQAEDRIAQAEAQAATQVRAAVADAAIAAAERMLRAELTPDAQARLIDTGVEELKQKFG
jgi:F-type H+-transporting ATPase subunit b